MIINKSNKVSFFFIQLFKALYIQTHTHTRTRAKRIDALQSRLARTCTPNAYYAKTKDDMGTYRTRQPQLGAERRGVF